ncbi:hypothetical protein CTA1_12919 [Colletotrichum tanaceti]|uniref:Uncharacterized protein n=1 Tax=Colletotrichum tanaceti TaxID=1306861 RepID=A0A4U6X3U9_9PEZI|nr:hypothetical protein CTA1_12919 [Colletotrichum tanaceti]
MGNQITRVLSAQPQPLVDKGSKAFKLQKRADDKTAHRPPPTGLIRFEPHVFEFDNGMVT